jgi:hypothetical protein
MTASTPEMTRFESGSNARVLFMKVGQRPDATSDYSGRHQHFLRPSAESVSGISRELFTARGDAI